MSAHKRRREKEKQDEQRRVAGRAAVGGRAADGEEKERGEQTAEAAAVIRMESDDSEGGPGAVAAAHASPSTFSRPLPPRADLPECELCRLPLQSAESGGSAEVPGRLPRLLPCGHCYCSKCIEMMLQRSDK